MKWKVAAHESGKKLLAHLREKDAGQHSVKLLKRALDNKRCWVNGKLERFASYVVRTGDLIELDLSDMHELAPVKQCDILFEDDDLLIVDKPPLLVCEDKSINQLFPRYGGKLLLIHRLDKETSGALMLAKSARVKEAMVELFRQKEMKKFYLAIVDGKVAHKEGRIESYLVKKRTYHGQSIWGSLAKGKQSEFAVTFWKCEKTCKDASLLLVQPITGRTHQIRVHLSEIRHPILGDHQYGKHFTCHLKPRRHLLHAYKLRFNHPFSKKEVEIMAPLPQDFQEAICSLF